MLVKDRMTIDPVTVTPEATFPEAYSKMREKAIRHLPVVDKTGELVGVLARTDMLNASPSSDRALSIFEASYLLANLHVQDVMSSPPITVAEDAPLEEAARGMVERKIGCLPVMHEGQLVGLITETDIFETFVEVLGGEEASLRVTLKVRDVRGELARVAGSISQLGGNICSVVRFRGKDPKHCFITLRLEGIEEEVILPALETVVEEIVHVCCAA